MRALILAAGRGERLRPLTDTCPKPLLTVRGKRLIEWHIERLAAAGVRDIVINCAWLERQFPAALGDGRRWGLRLHYCFEGRDFGGALETAGGIKNALPRLTAEGDAAFWVISGDVFLPEFRCEAAVAQAFAADPQRLAHLWLVDSPAHKPQGDFAIDAQGLARAQGSPRLTWSCIGLFKPALFEGLPAGQSAPLRPWLDAGIAAGRVSAVRYAGPWTDVGTAERLAEVNRG